MRPCPLQRGLLRDPTYAAKVAGATPDAVDESRIEQLPSGFLPHCAIVRERSARISGTVTTKLQSDADIVLAPAGDSRNPPATADALAFALWRGYGINWIAWYPSSKNGVFPLCLKARSVDQAFKHAHRASWVAFGGVCSLTRGQGRLRAHCPLNLRGPMHHGAGSGEVG